jgi:citrate lyase gamma subunit
MLHHDLPIYKTGVELMRLAVDVQTQLPRTVKRSLGDRIHEHCARMLDAMAMANATQRAQRAGHLEALLQHQRACSVLMRVGHDARFISHGLWARSIELLESIGRQAGGWLKASSPASQQARPRHATHRVPAA